MKKNLFRLYPGGPLTVSGAKIARTCAQITLHERTVLALGLTEGRAVITQLTMRQAVALIIAHAGDETLTALPKIPRGSDKHAQAAELMRKMLRRRGGRQ